MKRDPDERVAIPLPAEEALRALLGVDRDREPEPVEDDQSDEDDEAPT